MKKVALVTVNYNGAEDTLEFLASLKKLDTAGLDVSIIVVDNGSDDTLVKDIVKRYPDVEVLQNGINLGFTGGYNRGMRYAYQAGADYIVIINNDALIDNPNLLRQLVATAELEKNIGLVSPKIYFAPGFEFHKDKYTDENLGKVIWYAGGSFDWANVQAQHRGIDEVDVGQYDQIEEVEYTSGCCLLIKREVLEKVGYFDESLFAYFEDGDFMMRVKKAGFKKYYNGKASLFHKVSRTTGIGSPIQDYFITRNRLYFGKKYANKRLQFALYRQALKFLLFGRSAQQHAVWDFIINKKGPIPDAVKQPKNTDYALELSIVTVNYNTPELIDELLKSIFEKSSGFDSKTMEVVVLENGSDQKSNEVVKRYSQVKFIESKDNTGFSKGYNSAIQFTKGKYVLLLNSDTEVQENGLRELLKEVSEKKVLGGKLHIPELGVQKSCYKLPTLGGILSESFLGVKNAYSMYVPKGETPKQVEGLVMACFLIPRLVLSKVGLIAEKTFAYFEDIEYCRRLKGNNIPIYYVPKANFIHHHGASFKTLKNMSAEDISKKASKDYYGDFYHNLISAAFFAVRVRNKILSTIGIDVREKIYE